MRYFLILALLISVRVPAAIAAEQIQQTPQELEREIIRYIALLKNDGANARYLNALGFAYYRLNQLDKALTAYRKAAAADPSYAVTFNNIGAIHLNRNEYESAEEAFRTALKLDPQYAKAAYNLAVALYRQSKYLEAYRTYQKVKKIDAAYAKKRMNEPDTREKLNQESSAGENGHLLRKLQKEADDER